MSSDALSLWNFCACFSDVISRVNHGSGVAKCRPFSKGKGTLGLMDNLKFNYLAENNNSFDLLVLVYPLITSLAFENFLKFSCRSIWIIVRCPLMLTTISNSSPPIEQHPQVLCFMMNDLKRKKGGFRKRKKKDLTRKKGSGTCQSDRPSKNISLLPDLPRYRSETGHEINKGQEKWRNSVYSC